MSERPPEPPRRHTLRVLGQVQGVGFRPFVYRLAREMGLVGSVWNDAQGVGVEAQGPVEQLAAFAARLRDEAPALARVEDVQLLLEGGPLPHLHTFAILASDAGRAPRGRVTTDAAVCPACLAEMRDPTNRRHGHALINCTSCGPRYTIVRDLPYDRPFTTMADFAMCPACAAEYADPSDRRFHAQPTCCPACGPQLSLRDAEGRMLQGDPVQEAAAVLRRGGLLALKGLGGWHLVVDATREEAVRRLREGKRRDAKPFAVMTRDVTEAEALAALSPPAIEALTSPAAPIVLALRRESADGTLTVAPSVAPASHRLGLMLPYTPLQHLLAAAHPRPLVMTSANESDDPLIYDDAEASERLGAFVDAFLGHDRAIERAVDDSIVIDAPWGLIPVRRARGYVPTPIDLPIAASSDGLCVGGELKNTVAVVRQGAAVLSQHLGDLTWSAAFERFGQTVVDLERLYEVDVRWIACDAHPDYLSSVWARDRAARQGLTLVEVQHHHAHFAAVLAEHGLTERTIGLLCDGVGWGSDGTAWGGEVFVGDLRGYERLGRMRPLRLPGGDVAARETGRIALAALVEVFGEQAGAHPLASRVLPDRARRARVLDLLARNTFCPPSSGLGRLFDAAAALLGLCLENRYEAMSGQRLEAAAASARQRPSGAGLVVARATQGLLELDWRPLLETLIAETVRGASPEECAWRFHDALAEGLAEAASAARDASGCSTVALGGGVFLNALLTDLLARRLEARGLRVLRARALPPSDGAIAYGQAAVACARAYDDFST